MGLLNLMDDDLARMGLGLLSAGAPSARPRSIGEGLLGVMEQMDERKRLKAAQALAERKLAIEEALKNAQMQEIAAQIEQRKAGMEKQQRLEAMASNLLRGSTVGNGAPGGGLSLGGVREQPRPPGLEGARLNDITAFQLAGGPNLLEHYKVAQAGIEQKPGFSIRDGKSTFTPTVDKNMTMDGGRASLIPGVAEALAAQTGAQAEAQEAAKSRYTLTPPDVTTGQPRFISDVRAEIDAKKAPRTIDDAMAAIRADMARTGTPSADFDIGGRRGTLGGGLQTVLRPDQKWHYDPARGKMINEVGGARDVTQDEKPIGAPKDTETKKRNQQFLTAVAEARKILETGTPTESLAGSLVDKVTNAVGYSTPGAEAAAQLATISGWLTSNVPRMEGPQSNYDIDNYKIMAARVGDSTLPAKVRLGALSTAERLIRKYEDLQGGATQDRSPIVRRGRRADGTRVVQRADGSIEDDD